jgi:hypothetical protein
MDLVGSGRGTLRFYLAICLEVLMEGKEELC